MLATFALLRKKYLRNVRHLYCPDEQLTRFGPILQKERSVVYLVKNLDCAMSVLFSKLNYKTCKMLSIRRLNEAEHLLDGRHYSGAYYLAGYSIELALKAYYCKGVSRGAFPPARRVYNDLYSHNLNDLLSASGLKRHFDTETTLRGNNILLEDWNVVKDWSEESRHVVVKRLDADTMVNSSESVLQWIKTLW